MSSQAGSTFRLLTSVDADEREEIWGDRSITLQLDEFALTTISQESARLGVSVDELATYAVLYYLADLDSGRIARQIPPL